MIDLFTQWRRYAAVGASLQSTGVRAAATMGRANDVVAARGLLVGEAMSSPWTADHNELARMVPEKVEAASRAGLAAARILLDSQSAWLAHMQHMGAMVMRGRAPTMPELVDLGERGATLVLRSVEATARIGAASLAPFSRQVAANVRRLERKTSATKRGRQVSY